MSKEAFIISYKEDTKSDMVTIQIEIDGKIEYLGKGNSWEPNVKTLNVLEKLTKILGGKFIFSGYRLEE